MWCFTSCSSFFKKNEKLIVKGGTERVKLQVESVWEQKKWAKLDCPCVRRTLNSIIRACLLNKCLLFYVDWLCLFKFCNIKFLVLCLVSVYWCVCLSVFLLLFNFLFREPTFLFSVLVFCTLCVSVCLFVCVDVFEVVMN